LEKVISKEFSGHMEQALVEMVRVACDPAMRDAIRLEETMAGPGTKDEMLVARLVSMHWDRAHMQQIKGAYKHRYKRDLVDRIKGETSGNYERLLVAMIS
jgi:annexin A7/11